MTQCWSHSHPTGIARESFGIPHSKVHKVAQPGINLITMDSDPFKVQQLQNDVDFPEMGAKRDVSDSTIKAEARLTRTAAMPTRDHLPARTICISK